MSLRPVLGLVAIFVGVLFSILDNLVPVFVEFIGWTNGSIPNPSLLSVVGTVGRATTIVLIVTIFLAGFHVGRTMKFQESYRSIFGITSAGVGVGCFLGYLIIIPGPEGFGWYISLVMIALLAIVAALVFGLIALSGAAVADIRTNPR